MITHYDLLRFKKNALFALSFVAIILAWTLAVTSVDAATTYDVGPGQPLNALAHVLWKTRLDVREKNRHVEVAVRSALFMHEPERMTDFVRDDGFVIPVTDIHYLGPPIIPT